MNTLAILLPAPIGFHLFIRWPRDRLRRSSTLVQACDLADVLRSTGHPLVVGLVGTRHAEVVAEEVLDFAELVSIPEAWLRRVPRGDVRARAEAAARIVSAHRKGPVLHYLPYEYQNQEALPF